MLNTNLVISGNFTLISLYYINVLYQTQISRNVYVSIIISWHGEEKHINIKQGSLQLAKFYTWEEKTLLDKSEIKLPTLKLI